MRISKASSLNKSISRKAKSRGKRDGKNEVPRQDWGIGSVPYLGQLNKQFSSLGSSMILNFEKLQEQREALIVSSEQMNIREESKLKLMHEELVRSREDMDRAQKIVNGSDDEAPLGRFARVRLINNYLYLFFLFILGCGEFLITLPALKFLLGEKSKSASLVAFAVSVLSMAAAHIIGISLKTKLDRSRPQTKLVTFIFFIVIIFLIISVLFLSYIRAAKGSSVANNLIEIPENYRLEFLWALYSVLQFTFISVGSYLSFMHHSETESALTRTKRYYFWRRFLTNRMERKRNKRGASVKEASLNMEKLIEQEKVVIESKLNLLKSQYREACAVYRDSNIHNRRDELNGAHPSLKEDPLEDIG